jgi:hypothetical protein
VDPITIGLLLGGAALSSGGGILSRNDALAEATREAQARNAVVRDAITKLDAFGDQNRTTFNNNMQAYDPATQAAALAKAQDTRSANNTGAVTTQDPNATPIQGDASPATRADLAKRMLAVHDQVIQRAQAQGKLGGYSDQWTNNQLGNAQAGRDIGVVNNYAEGRKALVGPESDLAAAAAYRPPSIWGPLLSGLGGIALNAGGSGKFSPGGFNYSSGFDPSGLLSGSDMNEAATAGVKSGLTFNPFTGTVF